MRLEAVDFTAPDAPQKFVESLRQTGFGVLKNHPIQQASVASIYANWQTFFNDEKKHQYLYNKGTQDGYFPQSVSEVAKGFKKKDIKEYFHFYPWGQCPAELQDELNDYYKKTSALA
ncbi:MAG: isopenicillin N synthase-like dioxygenase, partial [Glaciecola sp.]